SRRYYASTFLRPSEKRAVKPSACSTSMKTTGDTRAAVSTAAWPVWNPGLRRRPRLEIPSLQKTWRPAATATAPPC
ncbi:unnamed protein product, partial [Ixodes persulcatus]